MSDIIVERFAGAYRPFSNFWRAPFTAPTYFSFGFDEPVTFPTNEHWFNAHKAVSSDDFIRVLQAPSPQIAKRIGNDVTLREGWVEDNVRVDVMRAGLRHKFEQHDDLRSMLLGTGDAELQEGNEWGDDFWGRTWNPKLLLWEGENMLGKLLMELRAELRDA